MVAPDIDAVVIATPTDLHTACIEAAARSGKAIFCEKPIDLDLDRARACIEIVRETGARLMVGFNRRFDPDFAEVRRHVETGAIGDVELVQITSRDPAPPPIDYVTRSGGLFLDMMIHDFDMVRFLLREEVVEVSATGSVLIDERTGVAGDFDTAAATLKTASGRIALISNSRRVAYGYDQRLEVHGSKRMVSAENRRNTTVIGHRRREVRGNDSEFILCDVHPLVGVEHALARVLARTPGRFAHLVDQQRFELGHVRIRKSAIDPIIGSNLPQEAAHDRGDTFVRTDPFE